MYIFSAVCRGVRAFIEICPKDYGGKSKGQKEKVSCLCRERWGPHFNPRASSCRTLTTTRLAMERERGEKVRMDFSYLFYSFLIPVLHLRHQLCMYMCVCVCLVVSFLSLLSSSYLKLLIWLGVPILTGAIAGDVCVPMFTPIEFSLSAHLS